MKIIIIILLIFLVVIFYLNKKSYNDHFLKSKKELENDLDLCIKILTNFNFNTNYIDKFIEAYNYFTLSPKEYNGTSIINDRYTISGLEVQSLIHDYDWIKAKSFKQLHCSNIFYANSLRKVNVNWIWAWTLFLGLEIVSIFKSIKYLIN